MSQNAGEFKQDRPRLVDGGTLQCVSDQDFASGDEFSGVRLEDIAFPSQPVARLRLEECVLQRVRARSFKADVFTLIDSKLERCDFANSDWGRGRVRRVEARNCKFTGLIAADCAFHSVRMTECVVDLAVFHRSVFKACLFEACNLREVDFDGADLSGCCFNDCDLRGVNLSRARVNGADFRTCEIEGLSGSADGLRGAIFSESQAPALARLLGVDLR